MRYQLLDHTADVKIKSFGKDIEECFENAAYAMFDQIVDVSTVEHNIKRTIKIEGETYDEKLYNFLSELLFVEDCESLVFSDFKVRIDKNTVECIAKGEPLNVKKHKAKAEIKAVTYHMLNVDTDEPSVTVIFDV